MAVAVNYQGAPSPTQAAAQPPQLAPSPYMGMPGGPHFGDTASGWQAGAPDVGTNGASMVAPEDPMAAYMAQFNASLGQSRAAIDTQLKAALGELGQRRDAAAGVVAGLPAALQQSFAAGSQGLGKAAAAGQGALSQDVRGTVGALQAPLQAALAQDKAGGAAMAPFLGLANMANYQGGEAMLNQQAMAGKQALDARQQDFLQQMALSQMQQKQAEDTFYAHTKFQHDLAAQDAMDQQAAADTGGHFRTAQDLKDMQNSPAYKYAVLAMNEGLSHAGPDVGIGPIGTLNDLYGSTKEKLSGSQIADKYRNNEPLLYALLAGGHLKDTDLLSAGIQLPSTAGK